MKLSTATPDPRRSSRSFAMTFTLTLVALTLGSFVKFPIPLSPIPVSALTFVVSTAALGFGFAGAFPATAVFVIARLLIQILQSPNLAVPQTTGYLIGMAFSSAALGLLSDRKRTTGFWRALAYSYLGSALVLSCGVLWLAFGARTAEPLTAGLYPFLPGDLLKNLFAAWAGPTLRRWQTR